ncbi:hypothetical protein V8E54_007646 [Elaphomyces granulatus]
MSISQNMAQVEDHEGLIIYNLLRATELRAMQLYIGEMEELLWKKYWNRERERGHRIADILCAFEKLASRFRSISDLDWSAPNPPICGESAQESYSATTIVPYTYEVAQAATALQLEYQHAIYLYYRTSTTCIVSIVRKDKVQFNTTVRKTPIVVVVVYYDSSSI